uniref:Putative secreted protein n=1 Tax=Anopheles darlingi TaxID=43151 RepID=A0A2M4DCV4_ANODA
MCTVLLRRCLANRMFVIWEIWEMGLGRTSDTNIFLIEHTTGVRGKAGLNMEGVVGRATFYSSLSTYMQTVNTLKYHTSSLFPIHSTTNMVCPAPRLPLGQAGYRA